MSAITDKSVLRLFDALCAPVENEKEKPTMSIPPELLAMANQSRFFVRSIIPKPGVYNGGMAVAGGGPHTQTNSEGHYPLVWDVIEYHFVAPRAPAKTDEFIELRTPPYSKPGHYNPGFDWCLVILECYLEYYPLASRGSKIREGGVRGGGGRTGSWDQTLVEWNRIVKEEWPKLVPLNTTWTRQAIDVEGHLFRSNHPTSVNQCIEPKRFQMAREHGHTPSCAYLWFERRSDETLIQTIGQELIASGSSQSIKPDVSALPSSLPKLDEGLAVKMGKEGGFGISLETARRLFNRRGMIVGGQPYSAMVNNHIEVRTSHLYIPGVGSYAWDYLPSAPPPLDRDQWTDEMMAHTWELEVVAESVSLVECLLPPLVLIIADYVYDPDPWPIALARKVSRWNHLLPANDVAFTA